MKCPNCNVTLVIADRQGIEIDYCPQCRGVWLDRGELDKIIERSASYTMNPGASTVNTSPQQDAYRKEQGPYGEPYTNQPYKDQHYKDQPYKGQHYDPHYKHKKKKGFLSDFFDFD